MDFIAIALWGLMIVFAFGALIIHPISFIVNLVRLKFGSAFGNIFGWGINVIIVITCAYFLAERGALYI